MGSMLPDVAVFHYEDLIRIKNRRQAMGNNKYVRMAISTWDQSMSIA